MASEDPKMSKQGAADKKKHITSMILQKIDMIRWLENGKSQSVVMVYHNFGLSNIYDTKKQVDQL
jgi:hypothetical protein